METDEILETGYGPATLPGDNLCNDFAQGEAAGFGALGAARGDRRLDDAEFDLMLADSDSPAPFGNVALMRRPLRAQEWRGAIARMHEFYGAGAGGPFLLFSAWPTLDLRGHGFGLVGHPPLMLRPAAPLPDGMPDARADGLAVRRVDGAAAARDWENVMVHGYPVPEVQPFQPGCILPERALAAEGWRHWVGYLDDRPVATASAYADDHYTHVEFISALFECRGRGVGAAMTAIATMTEPGLPATLIASDAGRSTYDRMGYRALLRFTLWAGHRGG